MTTIRDVAKRAGVSITTASYALNNKGTIGEATRKRVREAAEELNYAPNAFARHLKKRKTHTLGVFITRFGGAFYEEILEGIHNVILETTDYELLVCPESRSTRRMLLHRQVDGAIVFDSKIPNEAILKLASRRFPIVVLDRFLQSDFILPLLLDNTSGVRGAFQHLYQQGFRKLAFVAGAVDSFDNAERMATFLAEADRHGLAVQCYQGRFTEQSGYEVATHILQTNNCPEAVFCANDQMAIGFLRAMHVHGLRAPEAIAVVGFDDIPLSRYMQPSLSTVGASRFEWGTLAVQQLINLLDDEKPFQLQRIPTHFIPRQSSTLKSESLD
ncbi:MAG: LacI family transcriptional regulator [Chloroflexi bacterium CFX4]|nr:LacI family transcriptional regulator [Chloroflexi bacterium CFX4]MDL1922272.1 LacI family transcriptional regulator [Chloroflexi bacterium CFX3]